MDTDNKPINKEPTSSSAPEPNSGYAYGGLPSNTDTTTVTQPSEYAPHQVHVQAQQMQFVPNQRRTRPSGTWGDSVCDCTNNLWPSCYCACCICHGMWILGQMAEKHGFGSLNTMMTVYAVSWLFTIILIMISGNMIFQWIPFLLALSYTISLRIFIARKDNINDCGNDPCLGECCMAFWCVPCSIAQMARYTYGYTKMLDGDAAINRPDHYPRPDDTMNFEMTEANVQV